MQTLLVLTDFSEAASYAASYACVLARQLNAPGIVLYHSYKSVVTPGESVVYMGDDESLHHIAVDRLIELSASLSDSVPPGCDIRYKAGTLSLEEINTIIEEENADLVIMGTTGKGKLEELVAGSNAITVSETSEVPVVLVPSGIEMHPVHELIFACDMKETDTTIPKTMVHNLINDFHAPLTVLHVGNHDGEERKQLGSWLDEHHADYQRVSSDDTAKGILDFASQKSNPLIIVIAKVHGFPSGLFHKSITRQLAHQSTVPMLVIKEVSLSPVMPLLEI